MLFETFRLAVRTMRRNLLRSALTILGIVIGVGAVIAMVTIGNGATAKVSEDMAKLGSNLLYVRPGQFGPGRASADARAFGARDLHALRSQLHGVKAVAPVVQASVTAIYGAESRNTQVIGTDNDYFAAMDWDLTGGRTFLGGEVNGGGAACILGETVRDALFGGLPAVGQKIRVGQISCNVVGTLTAKGQSGFGTDRDDVIVMPLRAVQRRLAGSADIRAVYVSAEDGVETAKVQSDIEALLRERRGIGPRAEDDFSVRDMREIAETRTATTSVLTGLLGAVAGVSLLVGGIGIMNIMLVSVIERTREIGIRLAIGARESQVLAQFLVEAVVLSLTGGVAGIAVGLGLAWATTAQMKIPFQPDPQVVVVAFLFSAAVGVVFGFFPARRAARMDPIEALRHE